MKDKESKREADEKHLDGKHLERHKELHKMLDELSADFIQHTKKLLSETSLMELIEWTYQQTKNPSKEE